MAFFSRNTDTSAKAGKKAEKASVATKAAKNPVASKALSTDLPATLVAQVGRDLESVIIKPRITEKAVGMNEKNVYTFIVRRDATKYDVHDAVKALFKVTPVKVNIVNKSPRQYTSRSKGRTLTERGVKKAYVYLKKGEHIDLA